MKTLIRNADNVSLFLWNDARSVTIASSSITVAADSTAISPPSKKNAFVVADLNSSNTTLHTSVATPPSDWVGNVYCYNGTAWSANPNYVETERRCKQLALNPPNDSTFCRTPHFADSNGNFPTTCTRCERNIDGTS